MFSRYLNSYHRTLKIINMKKPKLSKKGKAFLKEIRRLKFDSYEAERQLADIFLTNKSLEARSQEFLDFRSKHKPLESRYKRLLRRILEDYWPEIPSECWRRDGRLKSNWFENINNLESAYLVKRLKKVRIENSSFVSLLFGIALQASSPNTDD